MNFVLATLVVSATSSPINVTSTCRHFAVPPGTYGHISSENCDNFNLTVTQSDKICPLLFPSEGKNCFREEAQTAAELRQKCLVCWAGESKTFQGEEKTKGRAEYDEDDEAQEEEEEEMELPLGCHLPANFLFINS
ncbi:hypothetical protein RUM43_004941 [Polyplax serrata]|uniref:Uncharacterized protein n=1 Tax=Polyplax serrata TaxID=468196 RepID=A0AAN8XP10_POLSC